MRALFLLIMLIILVTTLCIDLAQSASLKPYREIEAFNTQLENATRAMNNSALLALWADDGISLLPSTKPLVGKPAIASFLNNVTAQLQGAKMETFEMRCSAIEVSGDWASEWCDEHQVVVLPGGKPPFDGRGRMLFVLHREGNDKWRIQCEMWNQAA
jgi:uncharacterized protein (TIGR02246 family)